MVVIISRHSALRALEGDAVSSSRELSDVLRGVIDRDVQRGSAAKSGQKPPTYAAAAAQTPASPVLPPPNDCTTAIVRYVPPPPADEPLIPSSTAHAAAVQAAAAQANPQSAANAYAAALRSFGYGLMAHLGRGHGHAKQHRAWADRG